ncbi:MAG: branched-chain amino acid ABC transporter permease [Proteobacteria bacterium]|nr:branched-chain amino acid ABC transporter permease [Pseudomonadota bacterium]
MLEQLTLILPQLLVNALIAGSIYALVSAGLSLSYGLLKILNFAHGHILMTGVYFFYLFFAVLGYSIYLSSFLTLLSVMVLAVLALNIFVLPFYRYSFVLTFVTTIALANILEALVAIFFGVNVKSLSSGSIMESYEIYNVFITPIQIIIIVSSVVILGLIALVINFSSFGRMIRAIAENAEAAQALGVNKYRVIYFVFIVSVILATYAGIMIGFETNMQPTMGHAYTIKAFAAMVLGGLGNFWGAVVGSYLLGLVENLGIGLDFWGYSVPAGYRDAFAFMIILLMLLVKPEGLFNKKRRKA